MQPSTSCPIISAVIMDIECRSRFGTVLYTSTLSSTTPYFIRLLEQICPSIFGVQFRVYKNLAYCGFTNTRAQLHRYRYISARNKLYLDIAPCSSKRVTSCIVNMALVQMH